MIATSFLRDYYKSNNTHNRRLAERRAFLYAQKEGDMLEVLGRIGLGVCLCGYAAIVAWVWGWDKRKDRRERRNGESSDKTGAVQQGNVQGAEGGASAVMCEKMALAKIEGGHM